MGGARSGAVVNDEGIHFQPGIFQFVREGMGILVGRCGHLLLRRPHGHIDLVLAADRGLEPDLTEVLVACVHADRERRVGLLSAGGGA